MDVQKCSDTALDLLAVFFALLLVMLLNNMAQNLDILFWGVLGRSVVSCGGWDVASTAVRLRH